MLSYKFNSWRHVDDIVLSFDSELKMMNPKLEVNFSYIVMIKDRPVSILL